jgi:hydroxymethylpyrimidine/phosphomethylpyrimidine kinase
VKHVLTIAGYDPSSGAGITADLAVFAAEGLFGTSCITALTVQSTLGVRATHPIAASVVTATLECLDEDIPVVGVKIGMLATEENVLAVADWLEKTRLQRQAMVVVLDPVLRSTSGRELLSASGIAAMEDVLLDQVDWVTPNLGELEVLSGLQTGSQGQIEVAALALQERFPKLGVIATGGHLAGAEDGLIHDLVLEPGESPAWLTGVRVHSRSTHGTGCAFSSAFLCELVEGVELPEAARKAQHFVAEAIRAAQPIGKGLGPMDPFWKFR